MKLFLYFVLIIFASAHMQIAEHVQFTHDVDFHDNVTIDGTLALGSATLTQDKLNKLLNILEIIENNNATKQCLRTLYNTLSEC